MKHIAITGVSSGIGYEVARHFLDQGDVVFGSVRKPADRQRLEEEFGDNFHALLFDVTDHKAIQVAAEQVQSILGDRLLTALVNNAGMALAGPLQLIDDDRFEQQLRINVVGLRYVINAFLPMLGATLDRPASQSPGKIINMSSISGILNSPINGSYSIAKHAMESIGEVYRRELMMYGIDVVSIQPGPIQSRIWEKNIGSMSDFADSDYASMIEKTDEIMMQARKNALPASVIAKLVERIIKNSRPRTAYIVHTKTWPVYIISHLLPSRWVDRLMQRQLGDPAERRSWIPKFVWKIIAVVLILFFFTPLPGGTIALATGLSILVCSSLPFALFVQGCRRRFSFFNKALEWIENKLGERFAGGLMVTRPDADPRKHVQ